MKFLETDGTCCGLHKNKKYSSILRKVSKLTFWPTKSQHNDVPKLSLRSPNKLYITPILYFLVIMFRLRCWFDQTTEIVFNCSFSFTKG